TAQKRCEALVRAVLRPEHEGRALLRERDVLEARREILGRRLSVQQDPAVWSALCDLQGTFAVGVHDPPAAGWNRLRELAFRPDDFLKRPEALEVHIPNGGDDARRRRGQLTEAPD